MDASLLIARLESFGKALPGVVGCVSETDARWKPPSGAWSVLEIVNHLADEETDDFRMRVEMTLRDPQLEWPKIEPEEWGRSRLLDGQTYNERELGRSLARFVNERAASVAWLRSLRSPDWSRAHIHPRGGPLSAGLLLASWAAHDALHLRQIAKRMYELAAREEQVGYAGTWGA